MNQNLFKVKAPFEPTGDQPKAINDLAAGIKNGMESQVLLGVTGTGKTYTIAKVIERRLPRSLPASLNLFFQIITLATSSVIMTIISRKHICRRRTLILKRMRPLMTRLISSAIRRRVHFLNGVM